MTVSNVSLWLDLYGDLYEDPSLLAESTCLNCGSRGRLRVVFATRNEHSNDCLGFFWCDTCLIGVGPLRAPIPEAWQTVARDSVEIPDYALVSYDPEGDDEN